MCKGDLEDFSKRNRDAAQSATESKKDEEENNEEGGEEGPKSDEGVKKPAYDEELLNEMCGFSNSTAISNLREDENGNLTRLGPDAGLKSETKKVEEEHEIDLEGDFGTDGRPRVKEEEKLPPNYAMIDLYDPNEEILFEAELAKYKPGYSGTFVSRYIVVTETAFRIYKHRAFAISGNHRPLQAIPVVAFKKVERVDFDLHLSKKDKEYFSAYLENQFEIFLKDDFIDFYINPDADHAQASPARDTKKAAALRESHVPQQFEPSTISGAPAQGPQHKSHNPFAVRELDGKTHTMNQEEMHERFVQEEEGEEILTKKNVFTKSLMQKDAWTNREEEWYFSNKRMLFSGKHPEVVNTWVEHLGQLVTPEDY